MPWAEMSAVTCANLIFWLLLPVVLLAPPRWAVLGWLLMANLDATGPGQPANVHAGWVNAAKGLLLPAWLSVRLWRAPSAILSTFGGLAWMALAAWATVAALWSNFPLAGAKLVGNMIGILLGLVALEKAAHAEILDKRLVTAFLALTLLLGCVQTVAFPGGSFGYDGRWQPDRFTSFVAAQQYAALLAALLCWSLWRPDLGWRHRAALVVALLVALGANGSRTWFAGSVVALGMYAVMHFSRRRKDLLTGAAFAALVVVLAFHLGKLNFVRPKQPGNRLVATFSAVLTGQDDSRGAGLGTLNFRLTMYRGILDDLRRAAPWQLLFGRGTSTGGNVAQRLFPWAYRTESLDPNRTVHNEWLRVLHEWGLLGLALWLCVWAAVIRFAVLAWWRARPPNPAAAALLCYLPGLLLGLSTENIVAGAGNAVTIGFTLLAATAFAARSPEGSRL